MTRTRSGPTAETAPQLPRDENDGASKGDDNQSVRQGSVGKVQGKRAGFTPVTGKTKGKYLCRGGANVCGLSISDKEDSIMCDACDHWFHPRCQDLSIEAFQALSEYDLMWFCLDCRPRLRSLVELGKSIESRMEKAEQNILRAIADVQAQKADVEVSKQLSEKISNMEKTVVGHLKDQQSLVENSLKEQNEAVKSMPKYTSDLKNSALELKKFVQAKDDRENRGNNVIIHNIPESSSANPEDRQDYDHACFQNIVTALCGESLKMKVDRVVRLGKKPEHVENSRDTTPRPRLMLIKLQEKECVEVLIKKRLTLKDVGFPNTYITRDLPPEEREKQKQLRQELVEKGKSTHRIFRGKVVLRD